MASSEALKPTSHGRENKVFDNCCNYGLPCCTTNGRLRSITPNSDRSRMISGVSDIVEEWFSTDEDLEIVAASFLQTLDDIPSESSEIFPAIMECDLTPERHPPLPPPTEFCSQCGRECSRQEANWRCSTKSCSADEDVDYGGNSSDFVGWHTKTTDLQSTLRLIKEEPDSLQIGNEESLLSRTLPAPVLKVEKDYKDIVFKQKIKRELKQKEEEPNRTKISEERKEKLVSSIIYKSASDTDQFTPRQYSLSPPTSPTCKSPIYRKKSPSSSPEKRVNIKPRQYKVESTPPVSTNGLRHCYLCNGQVRPQMCGGNKHRWRCVDKKCRKWYGWVKSSDEMPADLGRKGRYNSLLGKTKNMETHNISRGNAKEKKTHSAALSGDNKVSIGYGSLNTSLPAPMENISSYSNKNFKPQNSCAHAKRECKDAEAEKRQIRATTPLTQRELIFCPSNMEKRGRWWINEKRRCDMSPERKMETTMVDISAAFKLLAVASKTAAFTRANEMGTVNGTLDLMMDSLMGSLGPLLSLLSALPKIQTDPQVVNQMWNASAVHIPIFQ